MIPRIVYIGERVQANAYFANENNQRIIPKDYTLYPVWRVIDHVGDFVIGGIGTYDDKSNLYVAEFTIPEYCEISASYSNPAVDTSNQQQRPYMIEWEIIDIQGKTWNFRETFEVGNPQFTTEIKEQQKITIPMASLSLSIPLVRNVSLDSSLIFQVYDTDNNIVYSETPQLNGTYGEYYIYSVQIPSNTLQEQKEYLGVWQFSDCPLGGRVKERSYPSDSDISCTTYTDTPSGFMTDYPVKNTSNTVFTQVIHCASLWELQRISDLRMYLDKVAKNVDLYTGYRDSDLYFHLKRGAELLNTYGLLTSWTLNDWKVMPFLKNGVFWLLEGAKFSALRAQYLAEGDSTFDFSSQPMSLTVDRTGFIESELGRISEGLSSAFTSAKNQIVKAMRSIGHLNLLYPNVSPSNCVLDRRSLGFPWPLPYVGLH